MAKKPAMWQTRDGRMIAIRDMDDRHLENAARMLLRNADRLHLNHLLQMTIMTAFCRGEMALEAIDSEIADFQEEVSPEEFVRQEWAPIFNACRRRKIAITKEKGNG